MGSIWYTRVISNKADINDTPAVLDVLREFAMQPGLTVAVRTGKRSQTISIEADDGDPHVVPVAAFPSREDASTPSDWWGAIDRCYQEQGEEGFRTMLSELSPFLASRLSIQATCFSSLGDFGHATEWNVHPARIDEKAIIGGDWADASE